MPTDLRLFKINLNQILTYSKGVNFLDAGFHVGVNTVGQSLRNANLQLRSEPPNPQVAVSPWSNTTIGPDLQRKPLELNESCPGA